ncbi:hypothetical protein N0V90_012178 [Kalmusia sp. IMI 367209]|nr:hypothetical protein N0V90_012178 [Kalmusia sp. IMI 367209]
MSNSNAKPPVLQINSNKTGLADGYVFIGVDGEPTSTQNWPTIWDMSEERMGTLVWTGNYTEPFDFRTQTYKGEPVLTFWSGELLGGYGHGAYYILNQSYSEIAVFSPVGFENLGDLHEFSITSDDTALVIIYTPKQADLSSVNGPADGWIFDSIFQEIDIRSGDLLFEWNASTHVSVNETYEPLSDAGTKDAPFDFFHMNSVAKDQDGNYLISARVMKCVYKISGSGSNLGDIIWALGGKQSDFTIASDAVFAFQHDARWVDEEQTLMTIFDNGPTDFRNYSRGLLLNVAQNEKTVRLIHEFYNGAQTFGQFMGSLQTIDPGNNETNYLVGYGSEPFFAEFDKDGNLLLDVQFGSTNVVTNYRAYKLPWQGKPLTKPDIHWNKNDNKAYLSWNGATDIEQWIVYTANATNGSTWLRAASASRTGFETTFDLENITLNKYIRAKAVNGSGEALGWTQASDGNALFDASGDASDENNSTSSSVVSTSVAPTVSSFTVAAPSSSIIAAPSSSIIAAPSSSTSGAAVKLEQCMVEKVIIAIVAIGGVVLA